MPIGAANGKVKPGTKRKSPRYLMKKQKENQKDPPRGTMDTPGYQRVILIDSNELQKLINPKANISHTGISPNSPSGGLSGGIGHNNLSGNVDTGSIGHPMYIPMVSEIPKINPGEEPRSRGRVWRLIAVIVVLCVSWFLVTMWAGVFDIFIRRKLKISNKNFMANFILAVIMTIILIAVLIMTDVDDLFHT